MNHHQRTRTALFGPIACVLAVVLGASVCHAQPSALSTPPAPPEHSPQTVTVTATRVATPVFNVPASISVVSLMPDTEAHAGINISESLGVVPGLLARDRQNYAQDVQISVRGFGARSTFGVRGVRLYVNGIPATLPDGQGQISNVDLGSAASIEVLRGPFSALYGNSSGGVLQVFTEDGSGRPKLSFGMGGGSNGELRYDGKLSGSQGGFDYLISSSHFKTDGYRAHSAARRDIGNVKLGLKLDVDSKLTLVANSVGLPEAQDPQGLTRAELNADRRGVDPSTLRFDTRKSLNQNQAGLIYEHRVDASNDLRVLVYGGHRQTEQFQSIPVASQASALNPGGVIQLARDYEGTDLRWTTRGTIGAQHYSLVGGLAYDRLNEHREGFLNFSGTPAAPTAYGVQGARRRNEINDVRDLDPYMQGEWHPTAAWTLDAGVRRSNVKFTSHDRYVVGTNLDDSGRANDSATLPVLGALYAVRPDVHLYASAGKGFETPTLNELAYRPNSSTGTPQTGLNFGLAPSRSNSVETGVKTRSETWGNLTAAVFGTQTRNEIVTLSNVAGRTTYQNVASTRRLGLELAWAKLLPRDFEAQASYTLLDARYTKAFLSCTTTPCAAPTTPVASGNRLPGIARHAAFAALSWAPERGWRAGIEARAVSRVYVNDTNSDSASPFATADLSAGYLLPWGPWQWSAFGRIDNVTGRRYVGSVIVNEGNARYFEPAPGRTFFAGINGSYRF